MTALIVQTPEREQYLSFTAPYISSPYVIFTREQDDLILDISDLAGKTLAVPRGFVVQERLAEDYPESGWCCSIRMSRRCRRWRPVRRMPISAT